MAEKVRAALRGLFAHAGIDMEDRGVVMRNPLTPAGLKAAGYTPAPPEATRGIGFSGSVYVHECSARDSVDRRAAA